MLTPLYFGEGHTLRVRLSLCTFTLQGLASVPCKAGAKLWAAAPAGIMCPEGLEGVLFDGDGDDVDNLPWLIFSVYWRVYFPLFSIAWMMVVMGLWPSMAHFQVLHLEASPWQESVGVPGPPGGSSQWLVCVQKNALKTFGHPQQQMFYLDKPWFVHVCSREYRPCFTSMPVLSSSSTQGLPVAVAPTRDAVPAAWLQASAPGSIVVFWCFLLFWDNFILYNFNMCRNYQKTFRIFRAVGKGGADVLLEMRVCSAAFSFNHLFTPKLSLGMCQNMTNFSTSFNHGWSNPQTHHSGWCLIFYPDKAM